MVSSPTELFAKDLEQLGTPVAEFAVPRYWFLANVFGALPVLLFGAVCIILWIAIELFAGPQIPIIARFVIHIFILYFGLFLLYVGALVPVRSYKHRRLRVLVFSDGFARIMGEEVEVFPWKDIETFRLQDMSGGRMSWVLLHGGKLWAMIFRFGRGFYVRRADGLEWEIDDSVLPRLDRLSHVLQQEKVKYRLPRAWAACELGSDVPFGDLLVSRIGLTYGERILPWNQVSRFHFSPWGKFVIGEKGRLRPWFNLSVTRIDNVRVLHGLVAWYVTHAKNGIGRNGAPMSMYAGSATSSRTSHQPLAL